MKQYAPKIYKINAFQITKVEVITPAQLANAPITPSYVQLTGEEDTVDVSREFVAKYQPNEGDWYIADTYNSRVVSNDYFNHIYN